MHPKLKSYLSSIAVLALAAGAVVLGGLLLNAESQNAVLQKTLADQKAETTKRDHDLAAAQKALTDLQGTVTAKEQASASQQEELKKAVDAFAKQAGACEELRHKLNVPGYTS
jgi:hypothetical protein